MELWETLLLGVALVGVVVGGGLIAAIAKRNGGD